jgi:hypothetical protein
MPRIVQEQQDHIADSLVASAPSTAADGSRYESQ